MAIVNTSDLPLKYKYRFDSLLVPQFTYKELLDYLEDKPTSDSNLYLYDIRNLLKVTPEASDLLLPDLDYLIFLRKAISIDSDKLTFISDVKCPKCGTLNRYVFSSNELKFTRPSDELLYDGIYMELTKGKFLCKLPTVDKFMKVYEIAMTYGFTRNIDLIKSMAMVNEFELNQVGVKDAILNATEEDIPIISTVYNLLYTSLLPINKECGNTECSYNKNGGMPIEISALIGNVFQSLLLSRPVTRGKIYTK